MDMEEISVKQKLAVLATKKSKEILDEQNLQHDLEEKQRESDAVALKEKLSKNYAAVSCENWRRWTCIWKCFK